MPPPLFPCNGVVVVVAACAEPFPARPPDEPPFAPAVFEILPPPPPPIAISPAKLEFPPFIATDDILADASPPEPTKILMDAPGVTAIFVFTINPPPPPPPPLSLPPPPPPAIISALTAVTPDGTVQVVVGSTKD